MTARKTLLGLIAVFALGVGVFSPAGAQVGLPGYDPDPAHHSTDLNDPDPAHHRPNLVCSTSSTDCKLVPIAGFDLQGNRLGSVPPTGGIPPYPSGYNPDPAHHSTDLNDPDPAHHQPTFEWDGTTWVLTPIPGFDLNGNRI